MQKIIKRIRIESPDPKKFIRLHRAEYGHNFQDNKTSYLELNNAYYPDITILSKKISKFHKLPTSFINLGLGAESLIKDIYIWHSKKFNICPYLGRFFVNPFYNLRGRVSLHCLQQCLDVLLGQDHF